MCDQFPTRDGSGIPSAKSPNGWTKPTRRVPGMRRRLSLAWPLIRLWLGLGVIEHAGEHERGSCVQHTGQKHFEGCLKIFWFRSNQRAGGKIGNPLAHLPAPLPKKKLLVLVQDYKNIHLSATRPHFVRWNRWRNCAHFLTYYLFKKLSRGFKQVRFSSFRASYCKKKVEELCAKKNAETDGDIPEVVFQ